MKKYLLIVLMLFLSGCSAEYTILFDGKEFYETTNYTINNDLLKNDELEKVASDYICKRYDCAQSLYNSFNKKEFVNDDNTIVRLSRKYNGDNLVNNLLIDACFENVEVLNEKDKIQLNTSKGFKCFETFPELEELTVKLNTKYYIISGNYDKKDKYNYKWDINRDNYKDVKVEVEITKDKDYNIKQYYVYIYILLSILLIFVVSSIIIKNIKSRKV